MEYEVLRKSIGDILCHNFYVIPSSDEYAGRLAERVMRLNANLLSIAWLEVVKRKLFGKPIKAIRIYCQNPDLISEYVKVISKISGIEGYLEDGVLLAKYRLTFLIVVDKRFTLLSIIIT